MTKILAVVPEALRGNGITVPHRGFTSKQPELYFTKDHTMSQTRYWASRISKEYTSFFWKELQAGRLRQGWGYDDAQDLSLVMNTKWSARNEDQKLVQRHRFMLGSRSGERGWEEGDIILIPNVPKYGMFALAKVTGPYRFEIAQDVNGGDFGHIREVTLITENGVSKTSPFVDSSLRKTMRNASRCWSVQHCKDAIDKIIANANSPELNTETRAAERVQSLVETAVGPARAAFRENFHAGLSSQLSNAEWESVIADALQRHFPTSHVQHTGGSSEQGADIVIHMSNPFGGPEWVIVVQVKDWNGKANDTHPIKQLRQAIETRTKDDAAGQARVISAVLVLTNATKTEGLEQARTELEQDTNVPVTIMENEKFLDLMVDSALAQYLELRT